MKIALRVVKWQFKLTGGKLFTVSFFFQREENRHTPMNWFNMFFFTLEVYRGLKVMLAFYIQFNFTQKSIAMFT